MLPGLVSSLHIPRKVMPLFLLLELASTFASLHSRSDAIPSTVPFGALTFYFASSAETTADEDFVCLSSPC